MGLQVWLPLNGNLDNQGLDNDITITTSDTSWQDTGKIGKCIKLGTINKFYIPSMIGKKQLSFCYWVRVNTATSTNWLDSITWYSTDGTSAATSRQEFYTNSTYTSIWYKGGSMDAYSYNVVGEWNHYAFTIDYEAGEANYYINGNKHGTTHTNVDTTHYLRGDFSFGQSGLDLSENDIRIYDHILSPREVKEISKGLVLHYPLAMPGQENLLSRYVAPGAGSPTSTATGGRTTWLGDYKITIPATENADTYFNLFTSEQLTMNATYTISCQVSGLKNGSQYNFPLYSQNNPNMGILKLDHNGLCYLTFTMTYDTQTAAIGANGETVYRCFMDDCNPRNIASGQGPITLSNFKLEKGSIPTPWVPNKLDALYTKMGFTDNIEYDVSGYNHNGTKVGSITYDADTPRYETSAVFPNNCNTYIYTDGLKQQMFTWACWFKILGSGATTSQRIISEGRDAGSRGAEIWASKDGTTLSYFAHGGGGSTVISLNTWYHIAMVCDGNNRIVYLNGNQIHSGTYTADIDYAQSNNAFVVGKMAYAYTQSSAYFPLNGQVSDVRIYATAISADDILELYHTPISLSNNGTLLTQGEYVES